jgi:hypothetical protein
MKQNIETYLKANSGAQKVFLSFSPKASIRIITDLPEDVLIHQTRGKVYASTFLSGQKPDITIKTLHSVAEKILSDAHDDPKDFLDNGIDIMLNTQTREKTEIKIHIGLFKIITHGYLKVLKMGGPKFLNILKENGLDSVNAVKKTLSKLIN